MDLLSPLFQLLFRSLVTLLPMTVGWLAFRRLALSRSSNAWIYAVTCLFAAVTAAGLLPWALGLTTAAWVFYVLAAFCPAIWIGVISICDMSRQRSRYGPDPMLDKVLTFTSRQKPSPLVLKNPEWPGTPVPVFRHSEAATDQTASERPDPAPQLVRDEPVVQVVQDEPELRSLVRVARDMRGNDTSDARRPKMLPPPVPSLPFIRA